ncbi:MAG: DUF86 domain-containing protein [Candidatus Methanoperedens sp.]|nr:DUF86 domain-containing protein [Candidatus Methanoperedens sp.]
MEINRRLIKRKAAEIKNAIEGLKSVASAGKGAFLSNPTTIDASKYRLLVAIEAAFSICNHIAARLGKKIPESYSDCFIILWEEGFVPKELSDRLARMAKFRNMLVHLYWEIDDAKVFEIIEKDSKDLYEFIETMNKI